MEPPRRAEEFHRRRRGDELPKFVRDEMDTRRRYRSIQLVERPDVTLRSRLSRWGQVGEDYPIRRRTIFVWILLRDRRVGAVEFVQYRPEWMDNADFAYFMDADSAHEAELGAILCDVWPDVTGDIAGYGDILEWQFAWVQPGRGAEGLWHDAGQWVLRRLADEYSVVVLKAFPLEYEGLAPGGTPAAKAFARRRKAMLRHYRKLLRIRRFPGPPGREGWCWIPHRSYAQFLRRPIFDASWRSGGVLGCAR